jgi:hypothetical protein
VAVVVLTAALMVRAVVMEEAQPVKMVCIAAVQEILVSQAAEDLPRQVEPREPIGAVPRLALQAKEVLVGIMAAAAAAVGLVAAAQATVVAEADPTTLIQTCVPTLLIPEAPVKGMVLLP